MCFLKILATSKLVTYIMGDDDRQVIQARRKSPLKQEKKEARK
jgi:hypothetical protein